MKRFLLLGLLIALSGCQRIGPAQTPDAPKADEKETAEQKTLRCTREEDSYELEASGDNLEKLTQTFAVSLDSLDVAEDADLAPLTEAVNGKLADLYGSLEGVTATGEVQGQQAIVTITIDYDTADTQALIDAGLLQAGEMDSKYVSLEKTEKVLEEAGYACE